MERRERIERKDCPFLVRARMSLAKSLVVILFTCAVLLGSGGVTARGSDLNAYQQLENYGFPPGLLPGTVTGYELNESGEFSVYLDDQCEIDIPSAFPVVYSNTIKGKLVYGRLGNLSGVKVKVYYFWLTITAITVKGDSLEFDVGIVSASYPVHPNFDENPICVQSLDSKVL